MTTLKIIIIIILLIICLFFFVKRKSIVKFLGGNSYIFSNDGSEIKQINDFSSDDKFVNILSKK